MTNGIPVQLKPLGEVFGRPAIRAMFGARETIEVPGGLELDVEMLADAVANEVKMGSDGSLIVGSTVVGRLNLFKAMAAAGTTKK